MFTRIRGRWYDISELGPKHPGGSYVLDQISGRDGTLLVESYHLLCSPGAVGALLKQHVVKASAVPADIVDRVVAFGDPGEHFDVPSRLLDPGGTNAFRSDLVATVRAYVAEIAPGARTTREVMATLRAPVSAWLQLAGLLTVLAILGPHYFARTSAWLIPPTVMVMWLFMSWSQHDAAHSALSTRPWVNALMPYFPTSWESPTTWKVHHNVSHHIYTNVGFRDADTGHGPPVYRVHASIRRRAAHRWWRLWTPVVWLMSVTVLNTLHDARAWWPTGPGTFNRSVHLPPDFSTLRRQVPHWLGRAWWLFVWAGWPWVWAASRSEALLWSTAPLACLSIYFMAATQLTHLTEEAVSSHNRNWFKHQVETADNFAPGSTWVRWVTASLNTQIEHHLLPFVYQSHYRALAPRIRALCERHGVRYKEHGTAFAAMAKYTANLRALGRGHSA